MYLTVTFIVLAFVAVIVIAGYYRIYLEYHYQKILSKNNQQKGYNDQ